MSDEFDQYTDQIIKFEGGYTNDKNDKGGETKYGIAKAFYPKLDIKNLTIAQAKDIYFRDYWLKNGCDKIDRRLRFLYYDSCVTPGPSWSLKNLKALGGDASKITPKNWTNARWAYYQSRIALDPTQADFREGWYNRSFKSLNVQNALNKGV
jgi:lysozyme family protein